MNGPEEPPDATLDRKANPFPANAPGPCIVLGEVSLWVLGESRYRIVSPDGEQVVEGFEEARQRARELAAWTDRRSLRDAGVAMPDESTAPDLVELTRHVFEAGNRTELDLVVSFYAPDASFDMSPMGLGIFDGRAALRAFLEDWFSAYEEYEVEADEIVELDNGVTLSVVTQKGRLAGSDGVVDLRYGAIAVWREGQIVLTTNYADIDEARSAAERLAASRG